MMAAAKRESLIFELEDSILRGSAGRRVEALRRITDLFLAGAEQFDEAQIALFDDVIGRLASAIETEARAELAVRLAPHGEAPPELMRKLAQDDGIEVAGPVLTRSPRLTDDDLIDIARTKSQAHLLAISERERISPPVTDVLVARGDSQVMYAVSANAGARFSEPGFSCLIDRSGNDERLQLAIGQRRDLPPQLFQVLLERATETVQRRLLAITAPHHSADVQRVLADVANRIGAVVAPTRREYIQARRAVAEMRVRGKLGERELVAFANAGRFEEMLVALSQLTGVALEVAERLVLGGRTDPILILGRAADFNWPTVGAIIRARPGFRQIDDAALKTAATQYECLSHQTAQRVVRFWQVRKNVNLPA